MEWFLQEGKLRAEAIEYTEQAKYYRFYCPHWGEPRLLKRETLFPSGDPIQVGQVETLNPAFEAVDLALAATHQNTPRDQGLAVATGEQLAELEQFDGRGEFPMIEPVAGGSEFRSNVSRRIGEDRWVSGYLTILVVKKADVWRLGSIDFKPDMK